MTEAAQATLRIDALHCSPGDGPFPNSLIRCPTDDYHPLTLAVIGSSDTEIPAVRLFCCEISQAKWIALEFAPASRQIARHFRAHCQTDGIEPRALFAGDIFPHGHAEVLNSPFGSSSAPAIVDDPFFHLEIRNAVPQQAADTISLRTQ